ncbi:MAG TPA: DNA/RNA non-specific endonuclease [Burkholderiaceae bacterium]
MAQDFSQCLDYFASKRPPVMLTDQATIKAGRLRALCYTGFAVLHSGVTRTPLYSAQRLSRGDLLAGKGQARTNKFFADARLPRAERAELDDYKNSGYDRGHMAPAADSANPTVMAQSFSLANMAPQSRENNRKAWASVEKATRRYVERADGDVYVITGPAFGAQHGTIGPNRVWVPGHFFKLVYDPQAKRAWAHWVENVDDARPGPPISYRELVRRTGIEFLPGAVLQP